MAVGPVDPSDIADPLIDRLEQAGVVRDGVLALDANKVGDALAGLVVTVVDVLRQVLEDQAVRRLEAGTLDDDQAERVGATFAALESAMDDLRAKLGVKEPT